MTLARPRGVGRRALAMLIAAAAVAGCAGHSSMAIRNESARSVIVRFKTKGGGFGFLVPASTAGWAWTEIDGGLDGQILVLDEACRVLGRWAGPRSGGTIVVPADGPPSLDRAAPQAGAGLPNLDYDSHCAGG